VAAIPKQTTAQKGNAGEHYANWLLHENQFRVYMADRNNPDHDMIADSGGRALFIRVKTTMSGSPRWNAKKDGRVFHNTYGENDFVLILDFSHKEKRGEIDHYVLPTILVEKTLQEAHKHFTRFLTRKGEARKDTSQRAIVLSGYDTEKNISRGFEWKWKKFKNSFNAIFRPKQAKVQKAKGPVFVAWNLLKHYEKKLISGEMSRTEYLSKCVKKGVNRGTAAVQYAAWKKNAK
jgi:hypothetical protein